MVPRFGTVSALTEKEESIQVKILIYIIRNEAENIFNTFQLPSDDEKKFKTVSDKFSEHFVKGRNTILKRSRFNHKKQMDGESADSFTTDLYALGEQCNYGILKGEMIRDRIAAGIKTADSRRNYS